MDIKLHANATTTPKVRAYIQQSTASAAALARELGISETTVRRWRSRSDGVDRSHARRRLGQSTSPEEEALICALRKDVRLSLDDLTEVMRRCVNADLSRSSVYRCLRRYGLSRAPKDDAARPAGRFEGTPFGYVHIDLKHLPKLGGRASYVFVAIERATRFAYVEIISDKRQDTVAACLERFLDAFDGPVRTILTDNGSEFTDRFGAARWTARDAGTGRHAFDRVCRRRGIVHKLTRPFTPQTNGMVERFNRRLAEILREAPRTGGNGGKNRFASAAQRADYIHAFVDAYNRTRLRCIDYQAPLERLANLTKHNTFAGMRGVRGVCAPRGSSSTLGPDAAK